MPENLTPEHSSYDLPEFLRSEAEPILQEWECKAREVTPTARDLPSKELRDSLPFILANIAEHAKEARDWDSVPKVSQNGARSHAEHRWNWGFTLTEVTREYGILRTIILKRLSPRISELTTEELVYLFGALDDAVVESVKTYVSISRRKLEYLATHDSLTGLPNRALLIDRLAQELAHAERNGEGIALMYLDLDLFKEVNDLLGHTAGDDLLKQVAERLQACVRRSDTVCRVGGDEFIILLTELEAMDYLSELGAKVASRLRAAFDIDGNTVEVSTSVGISVFPEDGQDPETLIKHADTAMYQAKSLGRNNVQFFAREMNRQATERRELQDDLRNALSARQLSLHFQPQIELATGRVLGAEVLLRWKHPRLGQVPPMRFIPIAEESRDIMISIGDWVLEEACRQARIWLDAGYPPVRMSVNISVMQLRSEALVEHVARVLQHYRLPAKQLQLELTESVLMSDVAGAAEQVRALEKMGVRIAVDDFGTGYSSLSYLKDLPVDELKIDQSFVHDISTDPDKAAIVIAVIRMGQSLNLRVIAEGVEDERAVAFLSANGCEGAQGYYYGKPVSPGRFEGQFLH